MCSSNRRMGSRLASLETWPGDGSITIRVPKKSRTCGQSDGTLINGLVGCGKDLARQQVSRIRRAKVPGPAPGAGRCWSALTFALSVVPMTDVTRILSAIEQGDP